MTIYPSSNVGLEMGPKMLKVTRDGMMTVLPWGWQDCVTQLRHSPPPSWLLRWSVTPRETRLVDQMIDCVNKKFDMFDWVHPFWWENTNRLGTSLLSLSKSRASSNCFWLKPFQAPRQWYWSNTPHPRGRINLRHPGFRWNKICQQHPLQSEACTKPLQCVQCRYPCGHVHDQCWGWLTAAGKLRTEKERKLAILKSSPASPAQPTPAQVAEVSKFNEPIRLLRPCPTQEYCSIRKPLKHGNNGGRAAVTLGVQVQVLHLRRNVMVWK